MLGVDLIEKLDAIIDKIDTLTEELNKYGLCNKEDESALRVIKNKTIGARDLIARLYTEGDDCW